MSVKVPKKRTTDARYKEICDGVAEAARILAVTLNCNVVFTGPGIGPIGANVRKPNRTYHIDLNK